MLLFSGGGVACVHTMKVINSNRQNFMVETQPIRALYLGKQKSREVV